MPVLTQATPAIRRWRLACPRLGWLALLLLALVLAALLLNLLLGAVTLTPLQVWQALNGEGDAVATDIIWNLRLPRVLVGLLVGVHFAIAGSLLQAVMRNPLADAGVLGINAGASLAAVLAFVMAERIWGDSGAYSGLALSLDWLPLLSCAGGILAAAAVYRLGWNRGVTPVRLVLSGIAVASVLNALATGVLAGWGSMNTETVLIWLAGSLFGRGWEHLWALLPWSLLALSLLPVLLSGANLLQLGDDVASSLGLRVELWRFALLLVAVLFAASAVGVVGPIGFIGLIVAQIARLSCGPDLRRQLVLGPLYGALLVMLSDLLGRLLMVPAEIPIGVITSLLGVPFFIYLLARKRA
ncbi:FecCD family ABC transporter permease [Marinobacterium rhizophilum]|uniref:FecCD family ABC transporter permease n=1 Tax=Marinobacterium rhizophilum TaxID=420402 RepID=UPI0003713446|nr:iron ABC transporter permease [Marinobacterium rhizophilum]